jgi:cytochrome c1
VAFCVTPRTENRPFVVYLLRNFLRASRQSQREARERMGILWIILIVVLVLALLGFFSRGYW